VTRSQRRRRPRCDRTWSDAIGNERFAEIRPSELSTFGGRQLGDHVEITRPPHARGVVPPAWALSTLDALMGRAAQFSGPAATPDLAYAEIVYICSLKWSLLGGENDSWRSTVSARDHPKRSGNFISPPPGTFSWPRTQSLPLRPSARSATTGQAAGQTACRQTRPTPYHVPLAARIIYPPWLFASKTAWRCSAVLRVSGCENQAQPEAALTRSTFTKSTANRPL
jgi:hypothetical protein